MTAQYHYWLQLVTNISYYSKILITGTRQLSVLQGPLSEAALSPRELLIIRDTQVSQEPLIWTPLALPCDGVTSKTWISTWLSLMLHQQQTLGKHQLTNTRKTSVVNYTKATQQHPGRGHFSYISYILCIPSSKNITTGDLRVFYRNLKYGATIQCKFARLAFQ